MFEMIIFNTVLTTAQRQQVEGYLAWKWGTQASLPGGHLYASAAPTGASLRPALSLALAPTPVRALGKASYTTTFTPKSIAGCQMWLDAADATTFTISSGSNVSTWSDKSGSSSSLSNTTGNPPYFTTYNGYPTVSFRGSLSSTSNVLSNPTFSIAPANISIFIITQALQNGGSYIHPGILTIFPNPLSGVDYRDGLTITGGNASSSRFDVYGGSGTITGIDYSGSGLTPRGVYSVVNTSNVLYGYANGTQWGTNTFTFNTTNVGIALGMRHLGTLRAEGGASAFDGNISEVIIYNTALTTTQRQQVEGYLAWKWGLQASLASGHPHLSATPIGASLRPAISQALVPAGVRGLAATRKLQSYTQAFSHTGANQTFVVPATTTSLTVYMWGAGGGGGHTGTQGATAGGAGAYLEGTLTVAPNNSLTIIVGGGGAHGSVGVAYGGGGSAAGAAYGGGGGRSAIQLSGTELVDAGGGGGAGYDCSGGYANFSPTINGGAGYPGLTGASWPFDSGGGGTQTAGGAAGPGNASSYGTPQPGTYLAGGLAAAYAGAGGSGYYGGGGGNTNDTNGAGGGGGSSYTTNAAFTLITGSNSPNSGYSAPASASPYYVSGVAAGSTNMTTGGNGRIVLVYLA